MKCKTFLLPSLKSAAVAMIGLGMLSSDSFAQFTKRSRRVPAQAFGTPQPVYRPAGPVIAPTRKPVSHWAFKTRSSIRLPSKSGGQVGLGYYQLPRYWGNYYSTPNRQSISTRYPSNITAYDSEFRKTPTRGAVPAAAVNPTVEIKPLTVANRHFQSAAETVVNSHFDLQQRLLERNEVPAIQSSTAASNLQGHAETAFQEGRYHDAAYYSDQATKTDPHNGLIHLFASQCHFATGKYSAAILMLEQATQMLPESQWDYIVRNYGTFYGKDDYVAQTRELANYLRRRPDDNRARTLLGYHYGSLGYKTTASKLFHQSLQTYKNDDFAQRLIPIFGDPDYSTTVQTQVQAPTPELLGEPVLTSTEQYSQQYPEQYSASGNRLIFLSPTRRAGVPVPDSEAEELPAPEEIYFADPELTAPNTKAEGGFEPQGNSIFIP